MSDPLDAFYRAELAATMRPCAEYHQTVAERMAAQDRADALGNGCPPAVDDGAETVESGAA